VLKPGRLPNTVDVDLQVADHLPLHGSIELNNRQQVDTKPLRAQASLSYNNLWQRGDSANVSFQLAPQRPQQSEILSASYLFHIPDSSLALLASYAHNDSNVKALSTTAALGRGDIVGLRLQVPLWFEPGFTQTLTAGLDYKNEKSTVNVAGTGSSAPISYYPFTIGYEAVWYSDTQSTDFNAQFVFGTLGLGNGNELVNFVQPPQPQTRFDYNRAYATPSFSYLRLLLTHTHELPYGMQAYVRAYAQLTNDPLVPFEQLGLGGLDTVRGYYEQEALVDSGGGIQTELRSPSFADRLGTDAVNEARVHLFADTAAGTNHLSLPGTTSHVVLGSVGVGARVRVFDVMNAEVQNAIALSDGPNTKSGADSVLFRLFGEF
jgi:hemolysin activation/secretion protein